MKVNAGAMAAFPTHEETTPGLSIRAYIATASLQGLLSAPGGQGAYADVAQQAVRYTDALIAELEKGGYIYAQ